MPAKLRSNTTASVVLTLRVTPYEAEAFRAAAKAAGKPTGAWLRDMAIRASARVERTTAPVNG